MYENRQCLLSASEILDRSFIIFTFLFLTGVGPETGNTGENLNDKKKVSHLNVMWCSKVKSQVTISLCFSSL